MALTANITSTANVLHTSALDLTTYTGNVNKSYTKALSSSDVTKVFHDTRSVTGNETLDLTSGLTDAYGTALVYSSLKHILIYNSDDTDSLIVGGGSNPVLANAVTISAGGCLNLTSTFTVAGSTKNLRIEASSGSISYDVVLIGA